MRIAICPGSFDPVTKGHIDIIERTAKLFDKVVVLVVINPAKRPFFTVEERTSFLRRATAHIGNVTVDSYQGLLADYAHRIGACTLIKGLRAVTDFEFEFQQALTNKKLNAELETMFIITDSQYIYLSSSMVKQVAQFGGDVTGFLPEVIREEVVLRARPRHCGRTGHCEGRPAEGHRNAGQRPGPKPRDARHRHRLLRKHAAPHRGTAGPKPDRRENRAHYAAPNFQKGPWGKTPAARRGLRVDRIFLIGYNIN